MQRFIVSIQGGQAVGKTTLVKRLEQRYPSAHVQFENPYPLVQKRKELGLDIRTEAGFIANQRLFIEAECQRFHSLPSGRIVLDRGAEDIEFYTLHYPKSYGADWDIEAALSQELAELRRCRSNCILYLSASPATLAARRELDLSRSRSSFEHSVQHLHHVEMSWFLDLPHTVCIHVDSLNATEVEETVAAWLEKEWLAWEQL